MNFKTFSILFLLVTQFVFSNDTIISTFNAKKGIEKVSYFRSLHQEDKVKHLLLFKNEFLLLKNKNASNKSKEKSFLFCLGLIDQLDQKHIQAISRFNLLLENTDYNLSDNELMDIHVAMQESYLKLNLYSKVFDSNKKINTLIKKGVNYPLWSYNIQSRLYLQLQQYDKAIVQLKKEIDILKQNPKRDSLIIPSAYNDLGYYYLLLNNNDSAIYFFYKSHKLTLKNKKYIDSASYKNLLLNTQENITYNYLKLNEYDKAINQISLINKQFNINKKSHIFIDQQIMLAKAFLGKNDLKKVKIIIDEIEQICCFDITSIKIRFSNLKHLYYKKIGNNNLAYENLLAITKYNDSIYNLQQQKLLKSTELNYVIEENEREVLEKNKIIKEKENTIFLIIIVGLSTLLIGSFFFIRINRKKRFKIEKMNLDIAQKNSIIKSSLKEKEILLKEIHHRVKNNLQIISGILDIQNYTIKEPEIKAILNDGQNRIQSIALLHKTMYQNQNFNAVNFEQYLNELITYSKQSNFSLNKNINLDVNVDKIQLEIDYAVPLGLIINELINNAYKHAFKTIENGTIVIKLEELQKNNYLLLIKDNGIGFPENFNIDKLNSIGYELINGLTKQLNGKLFISNENGATIKINFNTN